MMSHALRRQINRLFEHLDSEVRTEQEVVQLLGMVLCEDHAADLLADFPPERQPILRAGFGAALVRAANDDCLEAPPSALAGSSRMALHELGLAKHLLDAMREYGPRPVVSAICDPSFEVPWAVRIEDVSEIRREKEYRLIHTTVRQGGCDFNGPPPDVIRHETPIDEERTQRLRSIWGRMLSNVRPFSPGGRADGVTYRFASHFHGGSAWSPRPDTLPGRMAGVAELLAKLATGEPEHQPAILAELDSELTAFGV